MQGFSSSFQGSFAKAPSLKINSVDFNGLIGNIKESAAKIGDSFNDFQEDFSEMYEGAVKDFENWRDELYGDMSELAKEAQANIIENSKALLDGFQDSVSVFLGGLAAVGATGAMIVGAALNGIGNLAEDLLDFVVIGGAAVLTVPAALIDGVTYLVTGEGAGAIDGLWAGTQAFTATEWVNSGFEWFYTETGVGQAINENSIEFFQYGNMGYEGAKTVAYIGGTIALTVLTAGAGGGIVTGANAAKTGAVALAKAGAKSSTKLAFASGTSRGTSEAWNDNTASINTGNGNLDIKLNHEEKTNLENGINVSKDVEFTDENGNLITEPIDFVRNDDGTYSASYNGQKFQVTIDGTGTLEGLGYGVVSGSWEAAQWAAGAKLSGMGIKAVGFDIASGAVDVPFRSGLQALYSGQTFEQRFENNGGLGGVALNAAIAGGFSGGFEYVPKLKSAIHKTDNQALNAQIESTMASQSKAISNVVSSIAGGFENAGAVIISKAKSLLFSDEIYRLNLKASGVFDSLFGGNNRPSNFSSVTLDDLINIQKHYYKEAKKPSNFSQTSQIAKMYREKYLKYFDDYFSTLQFSYSSANPTVTAADVWEEYKHHHIYLPEASPYGDRFKRLPFSDFKNKFYPDVNEKLQKVQGDVQRILDKINSIHFDKNIDKNINSLVDNPDIQIGIHKTGGVGEESNSSIMRDGLFIHGAQAQGVMEYDSALCLMDMEAIERTVKLFDEDEKFSFYNYLTANYKNYETYATGKDGFIIAYPKNITPEQLYYWNDNTSSWHIYPQYIYGHSKVGVDGKSVSVDLNPNWYNADKTVTNSNFHSSLTANDINVMNSVYSAMETKYPGNGLNAFKRLVETGNYDSITRSNGAREAIRRYSLEDIQTYLKLMDDNYNLHMAKSVNEITPNEAISSSFDKNIMDSRLRMSEMEVGEVQLKIQEVEKSLENKGVLTPENKAVFDAILAPLKKGVKINPVFQKILLNLDLCIERLPSFRAYLAGDSVDASFNTILSQLKIGEKTVNYSNGDSASFAALHEFGHMLFNTLKGSKQTRDFGGFLGTVDYLAALPSDKITSVIKNAQESIIKNSKQVSQFLSLNDADWKAIRAEATQRFSAIADSEVERVSKNVDEIFSTNQTYKIESMLRNAGVSEDKISVLMENPEMVKSIFVKSNSLDIITIMHDDIASLANDELGRTNLDRMLNSIVQKQSYEGISFKYFHDDSYWSRSGSVDGACRDSYDELMADYFAFMASGREDWMSELKLLVGDELIDSLHSDYLSMVSLLEENGGVFR